MRKPLALDEDDEAPPVVKPTKPKPAAPSAAKVVPDNSKTVQKPVTRFSGATKGGHARLISPNPSGPAVEDVDTAGQPYVWMLNRNGIPTCVTASSVPDRMVEHFLFFQGEPVTPRLAGDPDHPEGNPQTPIYMPPAANAASAMLVWQRMIQEEFALLGETRNDLLFAYTQELAKLIAQLAAGHGTNIPVEV